PTSHSSTPPLHDALPIFRLFIDLEQDADIVTLFVNKGERQFLVASTDGQGFVVKEDDCVGNTRKGKQVLNVTSPVEARAICEVQDRKSTRLNSSHVKISY